MRVKQGPERRSDPVRSKRAREPTTGNRMNVRLPHPIKWKYDRAELWADGVIHVLGVGLTLAGAIAMLVYFLPNMPAAISIASGVYLASLLAALGISAVSKIWTVTRTKWALCRFDHSLIYLLMARAYAPFALHMGDRAMSLLLFVWSVAFVRIMLTLFLPGRFDRLSILL